MPEASVNGARLAWQQLGSGPDLLLVHGLATNRAFWYPAAQALSADFRVTLFDLRGHGYSELTAGGYRATDLGADILGLMDQLQIGRAALVGHSYGGSAALEAALAAPQRCSRLALLDARIARLQPTMRLHDYPQLSEFEKEVCAGSGIDWEQEPQVGFTFLEVAARRCVEGRAATARDDFTPFGEGRGARRAARAFLDLLDAGNARAEWHEPGADESAIAALPLPLLAMYADRSRCLPSGERLRALLPQARHLLVEQAGHFFPLSHPRQVIAELQRFLAAPAAAAA